MDWLLAAHQVAWSLMFECGLQPQSPDDALLSALTGSKE